MPLNRNDAFLSVIASLALGATLFCASARADAASMEMAGGNGSGGPGSAAYWQSFLSKFVDTSSADRINRIRYAAVTREDKDSLEACLKDMESQKVSALSRGGQKAFWINLYNAKIVALALERYPLKSVMDIRVQEGDSVRNAFKAKLMTVEGRSLSLDDIEHGILRPGWRDSRIHFALNCASIGCPNLAPVVFTEENIQSLMRKSALSFLRTARGVAFEGPVLRLSSIFEWYREDFGNTDAVVLGIMANYADPELKERLRTYAGKIKYQYDWRLNEAP